jgi:hypothetical protein
VALPLGDGLTVPLPLTSSTNDLKRDLVCSAGSGEVTRLRVRNPFSPRPVVVGGSAVVVVVVAVGIANIDFRGIDNRKKKESQT